MIGLKKNCALTHNERRALIETHDPSVSLSRQVKLLDISRSSIYYEPRIGKEDLVIMRGIDEIYTRSPFYGSRKIKADLEDYGIYAGRNHVRRLMRLMGLETVYAKPKPTSIPDKTRKYPYLLKDLAIAYPNHVWGTDITYVRLEKGFCYLVALLDWFSRYVIAWQLSQSLEIEFCIENLRRALIGHTPAIHNSDQGSHFTSPRYTDLLTGHDVQISMDGRGRCMDNIFTERLWRSVKYEDIYLKSYHDIHEAQKGLSDYFSFYNEKRKHQSLNYRTPSQVYFNH